MIDFTKKDRILIIAAHPDDEVLGCGGVLSKYSNMCEISVMFIAEGDSCRFDNLSSSEIPEKIEHRENCALKALQLFGINDIEFCRLPCGRLDSIDIIEINKLIERKIKSFSPSVIFTHYADDVNNDHRIVARSVQMAARPLDKGFSANIFGFEVVSSTEWNLQKPFTPNLFVELSEVDIEKKTLALEIYDKEVRMFPHSRSADGLRYLSRYRGMQSGFQFAEAFLVNRLLVKK